MNVLPSPLLAPYVKYYWVVKADETTAIQTVPSGCIHLVFHRRGSMYFSDGEQQPQSFIRGQLSGPGVLQSKGGIDMIAVIFHPMGFNVFFSLPLQLIYNQYADVDSMEDAGLK